MADTIAFAIDPLWANASGLNTPLAWFAVVGFTLQLYFDFSGYNDMAIGLGRLLGLRIPKNFDAPYQARNPSDFWRRWHITLSSWLRDYLYIPLGGNRGGARKAAINLIIVMLLGGLWHGAAWTFVLWGGLHGSVLVIYHFQKARWDAMPVVFQRGVMLAVVVFAWVLFRAPDLATAGSVYHAMLVPTGWTGAAGWIASLRGVGLRYLVAVAIAGLVALTLRPGSEWLARPSRARLPLSAVLVALALLGVAEAQSPFLYYQF